MSIESKINQRADELVQEHFQNIYQRTDRLFAGLLFVQWLACIGAALWISPRTWIGPESTTHLHVWAAVFLGGAIAALPILLALLRPGSALTRHVIAVAQMLASALLIHLTGGRIESHFHIFGSLALLAAYRDWRVLVSATVIVALDHGVRGALWPESVYGVLAAAPWRTLEHAGWVVFEDIFLIVTIRQSVSEMINMGKQRAQLESTNQLTEVKVNERTAMLKSAEQRLQLIIDGVPNGVVMVDQHGMIQLANPRVEEMFGYPADQLVDLHIDALIPEGQGLNEFKLSKLKTFQKDDSGGISSLTGVHRDGGKFPLELKINLLQTDEGMFVLASVVDVTERRKSEQALQDYAAQLECSNRDLTEIKSQLEQKNQELDEFTYVASHDLQEPVRKLVSFSKLLEQDLGEDLNERASRDLKFIVDAAARMRQLVQDLLALSRAGRSAMKSDRVKVADCLEDAKDALQLRIEETGARFEADDLPEVYGDRMMLTQLYQNLIGNALKFTTAESPLVELTLQDEGDCWILGVKDNGIGMKPEHINRIFKPFQRLHNRGEYEGTGIGLSICKKTVERHGGRLWVESQAGAGAHFKFTLPKLTENQPCSRTNPIQKSELQSC